MGFLDKVGDWAKGGFDYIGGGPKEWLGGKIDPFSNMLVKSWEKNPSRPPLDPALVDASRALSLTQDNPVVDSIVKRSGGFLRGLNPAAKAASLARMRSGAFLDLSRISPEFWSHLQDQISGIDNTRNNINTTTRENAFLSGFFQGGGGSGMASIAGNFGNSQPNTQSLYLNGSTNDTFKGGWY